jgi:hypothetical protein
MIDFTDIGLEVWNSPAKLQEVVSAKFQDLLYQKQVLWQDQADKNFEYNMKLKDGEKFDFIRHWIRNAERNATDFTGRSESDHENNDRRMEWFHAGKAKAFKQLARWFENELPEDQREKTTPRRAVPGGHPVPPPIGDGLDRVHYTGIPGQAPPRIRLETEDEMIQRVENQAEARLTRRAMEVGRPTVAPESMQPVAINDRMRDTLIRGRDNNVL